MADIQSGPVFVEGARVILLEDDGERLVWFGEWAWHRRISLWTTACPKVAISWLLTRSGVDALFLDQDLGQENAVGRDVSTWLIQHPEAQPALRIYVHSMNVVSAEKMERELRAAGRRVSRIPYTLFVAYETAPMRLYATDSSHT